MKKFFAIIVLITAISRLSASDAIIKISSLVSYKNNEKVSTQKSFENELLSNLRSFNYNEVISFSFITSKDNVESTLDAMKICKKEKIEYLFYGYISENEKSLNVELKLFQAKTNSVTKVFYGSDDVSNKSRLCNYIANNISDYICEIFGVSQSTNIPDTNPMKVSLPFNIGYWFNVNDVWSERVFGIVTTSVGLGFNPGWRKVKTAYYDLSLTFRTSLIFRYGIGNPQFYECSFLSVAVSAPLVAILEFSKRNQMHLGFGPCYELDMLFLENKYDKTSLHIQNLFSFQLFLEYAFILNDKWQLTIGNGLFIPCSNNSPIMLDLNLGAAYVF